MAGFTYTEEQRDAIFSRGSDLLVSAGAGSGKTSVLVQRIIEGVKQGGQLDRILALTFTKAAAADMRSKIDAALTAASAAAPDDLHLARQAALAGQAHISTIHSFCLELLRSQHYRVGLSPSFRVAGEAEMGALLDQVLDELFEEGYAAPGGSLVRLADAYGGNRDDSGLARLVRRLHEFSLSLPHPEQWLRQAADSKVDDLDGQPFAPYLEQALGCDLAALAERLQGACRMPGLPLAYLNQCGQEIERLTAAAAAPMGLTHRLEALQALEIPASLPRLAKDALGDRDQQGNYVNYYDEDNCQSFSLQRKAVRESLKSLQDKYCATSPLQAAAEVAETWPLLRDLCELVIEFGRRAGLAKRRRNWVDFADLEQLTLGLLNDAEVAEALHQSYDQVLVDEYQDINQVQDAIVSRLSPPGCLFSVGDVKQSIYRFRSAEPGLFLDKYLRYGRGEQGRRIDLNRNFRSGRLLVDGVNHLFRRLMLAPAMELDYDQASELKAGAGTDGATPEFHLIDLDLSGGNAPTGLLAEGRLIARRILELRQQDPELSYSQIAVLLRSSKNREGIIAAALNEAGIPALADNGESYADSPEVALALSVLRIIDDPRQELPLAAVLRSPIYGFTSDQLVEIRLQDKRAGLWQNLQAAAVSQLSCGEQARAFLEQLGQWRELSAQRGVDELLLTVYHDTALPGLVGAMADGQRRQANLHRLYVKAHQFQSQSAAGLFRFLCRMDDEKEQATSYETALTADQGGEAVQIMSIHKSKGLEFPVVFVAGLGSRFNTQDERPDVIYQSELGLAARRTLRDKHLKYTTLSHLAVSRRQHEQSLAEEMRILYVALTRARQRLILTASCRKLEDQAESWRFQIDSQGRVQQYALSGAKSPLDWLGPALLSDGGGHCLRQLCLTPPPVEMGQNTWDCSIHPLSDLALPTVAAQLEAEPGQADEELLRRVERVLDYRYPYEHYCSYPAKWSVSALNRLFQEEESSQVQLLPSAETEAAEMDAADMDAADMDAADVGDAENGAAENGEAEKEAAAGAQPSPAAVYIPAANVRGSAIHRMLELIDLSRCGRHEIRQQKESLKVSGQLSAEEASAVNVSLLERFFRSHLGLRLRQAHQVQREAAFTLTMALDEEDDVLVQGVIDAAFWEDEGWVLLDYKTGGRGKSDEELLAQYGEQLAYYRQAIERLWGGRVKEAWLCMLDLGRNIRV